MTVNKFIRQLLNLKGLSVTGFQFKNCNSMLNLWVKPYKNGCLCPQCKRRGWVAADKALISQVKVLSYQLPDSDT